MIRIYYIIVPRNSKFEFRRYREGALLNLIPICLSFLLFVSLDVIYIEISTPVHLPRSHFLFVCHYEEAVVIPVICRAQVSFFLFESFIFFFNETSSFLC